jgi:DegV family protein with EDD domain
MEERVIAVVTDSTADIPASIVKELGITIVPLSVNIEGQSYRDGLDITPDQFYSRLVESDALPTTSQPPVGQFAEVYRSLGRTATGIISLHVAGQYSGTVRSAEQARALLESEGGPPICIVDSGSVAMGAGFLVLQAARAALAGSSLEQIEAQVRERQPRIRIFAALDTLRYLEKGGRIGRSRALLGTLLSVKPIIELRDGEVHPYEQVRTIKKAIARLIELAHEQAPFEELAVMYTTGEENALQLADQIADIHPRDKIIVSQLGAVVGTHGGPGLVGFAGITKR